MTSLTTLVSTRAVLEEKSSAKLERKLNLIDYGFYELNDFSITGDSAGIKSYNAIMTEYSDSVDGKWVAPKGVWSYDYKVIEANTPANFEIALNNITLKGYNGNKGMRVYTDANNVKWYLCVLAKYV
jgi:hypothetical protein